MGNVVAINITKNGQYISTFPKAIAEAMRLKKGDKVEYVFDRGDVIVRKI